MKLWKKIAKIKHLIYKNIVYILDVDKNTYITDENTGLPIEYDSENIPDHVIWHNRQTTGQKFLLVAVGKSGHEN
jgi:hypothetical protein